MSKFDDDMARGCLPTGEPLEALYGVGWWTEHDEPVPYPYDLYIAELESRIAELEAEVTKCHELQDSYCDRIAELEGKIDQLTAHSDIERQDDKSSNDTQKETFVYGKERER